MRRQGASPRQDADSVWTKIAPYLCNQISKTPSKEQLSLINVDGESDTIEKAMN